MSKLGAGPLVLVWADVDDTETPDESKWDLKKVLFETKSYNGIRVAMLIKNGILNHQEEEKGKSNYVEGSTDWRTNQIIEYPPQVSIPKGN